VFAKNAEIWYNSAVVAVVGMKGFDRDGWSGIAGRGAPPSLNRGNKITGEPQLALAA
jgi:hypothetical protein